MVSHFQQNCFFKYFDNILIKTFFIWTVFLFILVTSYYLVVPSFGIDSSSDSIKSCNCVIFRMDNIQDGWLEQGQISPMNIFLSKNQSLSLGLIMNSIGNDPNIIDKVKEGFNKGLFELAIHGWNHVPYDNLTEQEQKQSMDMANEKLYSIFNIKSNIFIPPENAFNNDTLKALEQSGFKIISSARYSENTVDEGKSIFNASDITKIKGNGTLKNPSIFHIPETIAYADYINGSWITEPLNEIIGNVTNNINKNGYAIITLHPQNFVKYENNTFFDAVDNSQIKKLSDLIDYFMSKNIPIASYSKIIDKSTQITLHPQNFKVRK
jgi:peptidoglycan/xylan/chitin deacetylase (PgdA/CDA1 family)